MRKFNKQYLHGGSLEIMLTALVKDRERRIDMEPQVGNVFPTTTSSPSSNLALKHCKLECTLPSAAAKILKGVGLDMHSAKRCS